MNEIPPVTHLLIRGFKPLSEGIRSVIVLTERLKGLVPAVKFDCNEKLDFIF